MLLPRLFPDWLPNQCPAKGGCHCPGPTGSTGTLLCGAQSVVWCKEKGHQGPDLFQMCPKTPRDWFSFPSTTATLPADVQHRAAGGSLYLMGGLGDLWAPQTWGTAEFHTLPWHQNPWRIIFLPIKMSHGGPLLARADLMHTSHLAWLPHIRACMKGKGNCHHFAFSIDVLFCPGLLLKWICIRISLFIKAYNWMHPQKSLSFDAKFLNNFLFKIEPGFPWLGQEFYG